MLKLLVAVVAVAGSFGALSVRAELQHPQAYENLTAVKLAPGQAPRYVNGVSELSGFEKKHAERLPVQLEGAAAKIKKSKYSPKALSRDKPSEF